MLGRKLPPSAVSQILLPVVSGIVDSPAAGSPITLQILDTGGNGTVGAVTATFTDAVNGGQLFATTRAVAAAHGTVTKVLRAEITVARHLA